MKEYFSRQARLFLRGGILLLVLGGVVAMTAPVPPIGILLSAAPLLLLGFLLKNTPLVRMGGGRIEVKAGPFATKKIVAYGQIERVIATDPRVIILHTAAGPIRILTSVLEDYQRQEILRELGQPL